MNRKEITAITEKDFLILLSKENLLDDFNNRKLFCANCNCPISLENILSIKKSKGIFLFYCNCIDCKKGK